MVNLLAVHGGKLSQHIFIQLAIFRNLKGILLTHQVLHKLNLLLYVSTIYYQLSTF